MATMALLNEFLSLNGTDMSDHMKQATLALEATALDSTAMGDGWTEQTAGLKSGTLTFEALEDTAPGEIDAILWPLFGTVATFVVRLDAGPVSASNPQYSGQVLIQQHSVGGSLNEMAMKNLSFPTSGAVARATS
ncbi:hypothetical protein L3Q67_00965 [Saccharothrix sp. AJ9571]|nr:hypothetical protein L3Q67_00965 [Saccharothrix sp. AJ9571]